MYESVGWSFNGPNVAAREKKPLRIYECAAYTQWQLCECWCFLAGMYAWTIVAKWKSVVVMVWWQER